MPTGRGDLRFLNGKAKPEKWLGNGHVASKEMQRKHHAEDNEHKTRV